jgi:hypothetical protein
LEVVTKKTLLKLIQMYHPDKIDVSRFGKCYFLVNEEIVKSLNMEFNRLK